MKKHEIALLYGSKDYEDVETFEFENEYKLIEYLKYIKENHRENLVKIEISILQQDEFGETENSFTYAEIDVEIFEIANKMIK